MKTVKVLDKEFALYIDENQITSRVHEMAQSINRDLKGKDVIFLGILNGSFMFAAEMFKNIDLPCQISFLKIASYQGTSSSGTVKRLIGLNEDIKDKTVVILEDIVDTGKTLDNIIRQLLGYEPSEILIATMMYKPEAYSGKHKVNYFGFSIPNDFIIGYGLDYDGYGRNLRDIYQIVK